jgi:WD40 repeat protein
MRVSPDGKNLASGDRDGNIRIYDLNDVNDIKLQRLIEAHDREVICLAYSPDMNESGLFLLSLRLSLITSIKAGATKQTKTNENK